MKIGWSVCLALCVITLGSGCSSANQKYAAKRMPPSVAPSTLTEEQWELITKYDDFRLKIARGGGIPGNPSWEELRPHIAKRYELPADAPWERILAEPEVQVELTEEKRLRYAKAFGLPDDATWVDISRAVEAAKTRAAANRSP